LKGLKHVGRNYRRMKRDNTNVGV